MGRSNVPFAMRAASCGAAPGALPPPLPDEPSGRGAPARWGLPAR